MFCWCVAPPIGFLLWLDGDVDLFLFTVGDVVLLWEVVFEVVVVVVSTAVGGDFV